MRISLRKNKTKIARDDYKCWSASFIFLSFQPNVILIRKTLRVPGIITLKAASSCRDRSVEFSCCELGFFSGTQGSESTASDLK